MPIKFANNAFGVLASGISSSDTSVTLQTGQGAKFPSLSAGDYFYATLIDASANLEIVKCTARSTDTLTITRAQESTTARAFVTGDRIECRITADTLRKAVAFEVAETPPTGSIDTGNAWFQTDTGDLKVYYNDGNTSQWVSAAAGSSGITFSSFDGGPAAVTSYYAISVINGGAST
jgi:hypothetical protein